MNKPTELARLGFIDTLTGSRRRDYSRESATRFVIDAIESTGAATRDDFDVDRIVATAHALVNDWEFDHIQPDAFWRIAATCIKS